MPGEVVAVHAGTTHSVSKPPVVRIELVEGLGVRGDAHRGVTVKHRSRVVADPTQPNLRPVHIIQAELFDAVAAVGFRVGPGDLGENITTRGVDLLALPVGTRLTIGEAVITVAGLRNPANRSTIPAYSSKSAGLSAGGWRGRLRSGPEVG